MNLTVHFMQFGLTACQMAGVPKDWAAGHRWSGDWKDVTCETCLQGKDLIETFTVSADGKSITCKRCKRTSYNSNDVERHYCGFCHVFHDDLWPPIRKVWIDNPTLVGCNFCGGFNAHRKDCPYDAVPIPRLE